MQLDADSLTSLIKELNLSGYAPEAFEIADALWLAAFSPAGVPLSAQSETLSEAKQREEGNPASENESVPPHTMKQESKTSIYSSPGLPENSGRVGNWREIRTPSGSSIPGMNTLSRELRPLMRRVPSRRKTQVDIEKTVQRYCDTKKCVVVMRSKSERNVELILAVDGNATMIPWMQPAREFAAALKRTGVFFSVQTFEIVRHENKLSLRKGLSSNFTSGNSCRFEPLRAGKKRAILLLTDGVGQSWRDGEMGSLIEIWSKGSHVALLQPLPDRLWSKTPIGSPTRRFTLKRHKGNSPTLVPNRPRPAIKENNDNKLTPVLMLPFIGKSLSGWAGLTAEKSAIAVPGTYLSNKGLGGQSPQESHEPTAEALYHRFATFASDEALALASHLSIYDLLSLPVIRLFHNHLSSPEPGQIAELLVSGMLKRASSAGNPNDNPIPVERASYQFRGDVAEYLLSGLRSSDRERLFNLVSNYVEKEFGKSKGEFIAYIRGEEIREDIGSGDKEAFQAFAQISKSVIDGIYPSNPSSSYRKKNPKDGAEMVWIPEGEFIMGSEEADAYEDEKPPHKVVLTKGYWLYRTQVTVAQFRNFIAVSEYDYDMDKRKPSWGWIEDHPMVNVSWHDAEAYCKWAGTRLPTEAEWERAAKGPEGAKYPWGEDWDETKCQSSKKAYGDAKSTSRVGQFGEFGFGLCDTSGNVYEWCNDWYDGNYYQTSPKENPENLNKGDTKSLRGGSWYNIDPRIFRSSDRNRNLPDNRGDNYGFRCASNI